MGGSGSGGSSSSSSQIPPPRPPSPPRSAQGRGRDRARALGAALLHVASGRHPLSWLVAPLLWAADALLCALIIWRVPYTEIDWVAYMQQVGQFVAGERDYPSIKGGTGPLVYPAAHVYTYTALYHLTDAGTNVRLAQQVFAAVYLATLALVMACYRAAGAPPYLFPLLVLSKRLHSVFMLRCFNDGFAALAMWAAIYLLQRRLWTAAALAYGWGLGTKMSQLLILPAVGLVLFLGRGFRGGLRAAWLVGQVQLVIALPFMVRNPVGYLTRAFELSRVFKFEWTVNWRMLGEQVFLSSGFAGLLLGLHGAALLVFLHTRWLRPSGRSLPRLLAPLFRGRPPLTAREEEAVYGRVTPEYVLTTVLTANVIGLLFARSLHYQFYAYLGWATPFLLWRANMAPLVVYALWAAQEWAWNVFPSTPASSSVVVAVMGMTVGLVWLGTREGREGAPLAADTRKDKHQ